MAGIPNTMVALDASRGAPGVGVITVTPADADLSRDIRAFYVGVAGDVSITAPDGSSGIFKNVPGGTTISQECRRINLTGTSATFILGQY